MSRFDDCFQFVIGSEGHYSNDSHDVGGETMFGITRRDHPSAWLTGPPSLDVAKEIYRAEYWNACGCDKMPEPWDLLIFDAAVNMGRYSGVMLAQKALGVVEDGRVGPVTVAAAKNANEEQVAMCLAYRAVRYATTHGFDRFGRGWLKRTYLLAMSIARG